MVSMEPVSEAFFCVPYYDEFVQILCVVFQRDYQVFLSGFDFDGLGFVSEE